MTTASLPNTKSFQVASTAASSTASATMSESIRPSLKMNNLFVRDINKAVSPAIVRATLEKATGLLCKVVIPLDYKTGQSTHIGQAYLNFDTEAEAECCLEKIRFKLVFGKQRAKVLFAPLGNQSDRDKVWGPFAYKFQIIVKNLSEEVEVEAFYEFFSKFGEILQCKTDTDNYGQYFGQVQYMNTASVPAAVEGANGTRWHGAVIQVVPHHKAALADTVAVAARPKVDVSSASSFPALGASSSGSAGATPTPSRPNTQQQQQQQQQQPAAAAVPGAAGPTVRTPGPVNFAVQALEGSSSSGSGHADSPSGPRPLGAFNASGSDLHVGAPVVAPLALPVAAPVAAPVVAPVAVPVAEFSGATTGPAARAGAPAGGPGAGVQGMSLLHRIMLNRAEAAAGGAAAPPAGPEAESALQPPATPSNGAVGAGRANGNCRKGGLLKSLVQTLDQVSELLCCPITHEVLRDPVVAADGITYERQAITAWLASHDTSPMTNIRLANLQLHPNNLVRTLIEELM